MPVNALNPASSPPGGKAAVSAIDADPPARRDRSDARPPDPPLPPRRVLLRPPGLGAALSPRPLGLGAAGGSAFRRRGRGNRGADRLRRDCRERLQVARAALRAEGGPSAVDRPGPRPDRPPAA